MKSKRRNIHRIISVTGWLLIIFIIGFILSQRVMSQTDSSRVVQQPDSILRGTVTYVIDGETFTLELSQGTSAKIKLYGVSIPKYNQPYGSLATAFVNKLLEGKYVECQIKDKLRSGLLVCQVHIVKISVNTDLTEELLKNGLAWHDKKQYPNQHLSELEEHAQKSRVGLWASENPIAPWSWYKRK